MTGIRTGGSAYPQSCLDGYGMGPGTIDESEVFDVRGMTLRDHFAGKALVGILANVEVLRLAVPDMRPSDVVQDVIAEAAYEQADAMISARDKAASNPVEDIGGE